MSDEAHEDLGECLAALTGAPAPDDVDAAHDPAPGSLRGRLDANGNALVLYVARDPFPPARFWPADGSRGRLVPLRGKNRNEVEARHAVALPVRVTHDGVRLAMPTATTLSTTHLYVPPPDRAGDGLAEAIAHCEAQLAAYDAWRRGEIYGVVRETFALDGGEFVSLDVRAEWPRLDLAGALELLDRSAGPPSPAPSRVPAP